MLITQTPLRVSFFGGGTDIKEFYRLDGGAVLSTTIDKYIYIIIKARYDDLIVLNYSEKEIVSDVLQIKHNIFRECLRLVGIAHGVEITSIADIPAHGSGLGSSSSFTVGLLNALYAFVGEAKNAYELAVAACHVEIDILKEPIGKQDQFAAAFGGVRIFSFNQDDSVSVKPVSMSGNALTIIQRSCHIYYTGISRRASTILSDQKANIPQTKSSLNRMKNLAFEAVPLFEKGEIEKIGRLLHANWMEKRKLSSRISTASLDEKYEAALAAGALGGKILGAGGGGFFFFICSPERKDKLDAAMDGLRAFPFSFSRFGSRVIFCMNDMVSNIF